MARTWLALPLALLVIAGGACGDSTSPKSPDPKPKPSPTAASVSVLAGDGQSIPAGEPAPVAPAVVVRDLQGKPFAGATVQFSVTAGGGTLEGATKVTDASGIARVTSWTVGTSGAQSVTAVVGSLTPAAFEATLVPGTEFIEESVPTAGGVITISTPGHPYEGLTLTVPPGTFSGTVNMSLRVASNAPVPSLPAGYRVGGPLLEITTDAPRSGQLMTLEVPIQQQPGEAAVLVYFDPARQVMEVLPTVARSDTSVRVVTRHLRADLLLGPNTLGQGQGSVTGQLLPVIHSMVQPPVPQLYDPSTNGWPVVDHGSAEMPDGFGSAIPAVQVMTSNLGISPTSIVRGLDTPGFYADAGILASMQAAAQAPGITPGQMDALFSKFAGLPKALRDEYVRQNVTASLALLNKPGFAALFNSATGPTADETWFATTVASSGGGLTLSQAAEPPTGTLGHTANGFMDLFAKKTGDGPSTSVDGALPMSSFVFDFTKTSPVLETLKKFEGLTLDQRRIMNDQVREVFGLAKAIFETEPVPGTGYTTHPGGPFVMRGDTFKVRIAGGQYGLWIHDPDAGAGPGPNSVSSPDVEVNGVLDFVSFEGLPGVGVNFVGRMDLSANIVRAISSMAKRMGPLIRQQAPEGIDVVSAPFSVTPDTVFISTASTVTFQADVPSPPADGFRIRWDWGDGTTSENPDSTGATHRYDPPGDYWVTVELLSADGSRVLAIDYVRVKQVTPNWRLTNISNADELGSAASVPITVLLADAVANPSSAMISVENGLFFSRNVLLRVLDGGYWDIINCCISIEPFPNETGEVLGVVPTLTESFGPFFNGFESSWWSESTSDLNSGTMEGQYIVGFFDYWVWNPVGEGKAEAQRGPKYVMRFNATRNGTEMTGTITVIFWPIGDLLPLHTVQLVDYPESYAFPFTATRIR